MLKPLSANPIKWLALKGLNSTDDYEKMLK